MKSITVNEATENINEYLKSDNRYPYFVSVNGSHEYRLLLNHFESLNKIRISEFCNEDAYPNTDGFIDAINKEGKSEKLILGVGDYITCGGNVDILYRLKNLAAAKTVILCRGIRQKLSGLNHTDRKFNARRFCCVDSELDFSVISTQYPIGLQLCEGYKKLISYLEEGANGNIYVKTDLNVAPARKICSAYDAICEENSNFNVPETCLNGDQWNEFLENPDISGSYELSSWRSYLKFKLGISDTKDYLRAVVEASANYQEYKKNIYDLILSYSPKSKEYSVFYPQRKELLKKVSLDTEINSYLAESKQREKERIYYLTNNTEEEEYEIIKEIVSLGVIPNEIDSIFPELDDYLCKYSFDCKSGDVLTEYFQEYKSNKLLNRISETFLKTVKEYSIDGNRKYNVLPSRGSLIEQYNDSKNGLIWIDALGVEFLGYIQRICAKIGLKMNVQIGRAVLPTLTSQNRAFYDEWRGPKQQTKRLDDIKHKGEDRFNYETDGKLPLHIVAELKVIKDALVEAKGWLLREEVRKVIIASDHGASRLAVINEHQSKHTMSDTTGKHSGRCCPLSETDEKPESASSANGFWVLANYDRFGGGRKASVEVHGGATLEEVVVPVIELTLIDSSITLENLTPTVWSSYNEDPILEIFCAAKVDKMRLRVGEVTYEANKLNDEKYHYCFVLDKHKKSGTYTAEVLDSDAIIGKVSFDVQKRSGGKNSKIEDDFFI